MDAFVLGLIAAAAWGALLVPIAWLSREIGGVAPAFWIAVSGAAVGGATVLTTGQLADSGQARDVGLAAAAGVAYVGGVLLAQFGLARGTLSLVGPIVATDGAAAALLAVLLLGERLSGAMILALGVVIVGIVLAARDPRQSRGRHATFVPVAAAVAASGCFACFFLASSAAVTLGAFGVVAVARLVGAMSLIPVARGRLRIPFTPKVVGAVVAVGILDVIGIAAFVEASADGVAVASVLASLYGAVAALAGVLVLRERPSPGQYVGVGLMTCGVVLVATAR